MKSWQKLFVLRFERFCRTYGRNSTSSEQPNMRTIGPTIKQTYTYTLSQKRPTLSFAVTLTNIEWFSKLFHMCSEWQSGTLFYTHVDQLVSRQPHSVCPLSRIQVDSSILVLCMESHKGRSSGRYSSFYIQRIWCGWWSPLHCVRPCMPTTPRSTGSVDRALPTVYGIVLLIVSLLSPTGCASIDFNLTHRRRRYCGAPQPVDKVSYPPIQWPLDAT